MKNNKCPYCKEKNDVETPVDGSGKNMSQGDMSVCLYCSEISVFSHGRLRKATEWEKKKAMDDLEVIKAIALTKYFQTLHRKNDKN